MHYLTKALKQLTGVYYTPKKVTDKIQLDLLIANPPYATKTILIMKIKSKSQQAKKVQELFLDLLHQSEYKRLSDFAREHKLNYAVTHHRIHPQTTWMNLEHINHLVQLIDKRKRIELNGENVKIITQISN